MQKGDGEINSARNRFNVKAVLNDGRMPEKKIRFLFDDSG